MKRALAVLLLTTALQAAAAPASAGNGLEISGVTVDHDVTSVDLTLSVGPQPSGLGLDAASVRLSADGRELPATAAVSGSEQTTDAPTVLLVVDTSGSMRGGALDEARRALRAFVAEAPVAAEVGLLRFSAEPQLLVAPTTDRPRLLGALGELTAQGETAFNDAVLAGLRALGPTGDRRLVVISDGGDTSSSAGRHEMLQAVAAAGVVVDAIALRTDESVTATLAQVAAAGHGRVHRASSAADLSAALTSTTRTRARRVAVHALVPADLRGAHVLDISVASTAGVLSGRTPVTLGRAPARPRSAAGFWGSRAALLLGCTAVGSSLLLVTVALLGGGRQRQRRRVHRLLHRYTTTAPQVEVTAPAAVTRSLLQVADRVAARRGMQDKLALALDRAAVTMTPGEWLLMQAGLLCAGVLLVVATGGNLLVALLVGGLLGGVAPGRVLASRGRRRQKRFEVALPDMLQMTAGSLSAGYSLAQALDGVVREGSEPMATELGRALAESRLGVPVETTLEAVATRMASRDFAWVVMAIRVQREVGGNLAGILTTVSTTMRERAMLRRHVRGLSAEGRLSAYILIGLPCFLALYMLTLRRSFIRPLYTTGIGIAMITVALLLLAIGSLLMSRMVKVEV